MPLSHNWCSDERSTICIHLITTRVPLTKAAKAEAEGSSARKLQLVLLLSIIVLSCVAGAEGYSAHLGQVPAAAH